MNPAGGDTVSGQGALQHNSPFTSAQVQTVYNACQQYGLHVSYAQVNEILNQIVTYAQIHSVGTTMTSNQDNQLAYHQNVSSILNNGYYGKLYMRKPGVATVGFKRVNHDFSANECASLNVGAMYIGLVGFFTAAAGVGVALGVVSIAIGLVAAAGGCI